VLIFDVREGTPAARAGLKKYDVVLSFDGVKITRDVRVFHEAIGKAPAKKGVEAVVIRRGQKTTVKDIVLPEPAPAPASPFGVYAEPRDDWGRAAWAWFNRPDIKDGTSNTILFNDWANSARLILPPDAVTAAYSDESVTLTVVGAPEKGKVVFKSVRVTHKGETKDYDDLDKAPEAYREKARALFALMEKRPAPAESK
jgi:hypothetical protein